MDLNTDKGNTLNMFFEKKKNKQWFSTLTNNAICGKTTFEHNKIKWT